MTSPVETRAARPAELIKAEVPILAAGVATLGMARYLSRFDLSTGPILCPLRRFTGVPCPFCGMTTSFAHLAGGRFWDSFVASPLGPVLFAITAFAIIALAWAVITRRRVSFDFSMRARRIAKVAAGIVLALLMVYQAFRIGPLHALIA